MIVKLPWKRAMHIGGSRKQALRLLPLPWLESRMQELGLHWKGGKRKGEWPAHGLPLFESYPDVFEPIFIYGKDEEVALLKLKYF